MNLKGLSTKKNSPGKGALGPSQYGSGKKIWIKIKQGALSSILETGGRRPLKTKFGPPSRPPAHMGNTEVTHVVQELSLNWVQKKCRLGVVQEKKGVKQVLSWCNVGVSWCNIGVGLG